jgi:polyhydroxybutyrate depolymerase
MEAPVRRAGALAAGMALAVGCGTYGPTFAGDSPDWSVGTSLHSADVGSLTRNFSVHIPTHRRLSTAGVTLPWPLVIVLHGSSGDAAAIEEQSGMDSVAEAQRFIVAYPNGTGGAFDLYPSDWNAGTCCGAANRDGIDDLGFMSALIATVAAHVPLDAHRVYIAGFSAGGYMAYHAGCQLSPLIAAVGVVEGALADDSCAPTQAMPLFAVHGTDDPEVSFDEPAPDPPAAVPALAAVFPPAVQFWSALNGCAAKTAKATAKSASAHVQLFTLTTCAKADVTFYTIQGGTHGWPGGPDDPGASPPMNEMKASVLMWTFFIAHSR